MPNYRGPVYKGKDKSPPMCYSLQKTEITNNNNKEIHTFLINLDGTLISAKKASNQGKRHVREDLDIDLFLLVDGLSLVDDELNQALFGSLTNKAKPFTIS